MQNAIQVVFPNTKHRLCLWHILKKLPEKFGYQVDKGSIFGDIHGLVYDSQSTGEFEDGWRTIIDTYELHDNDWLSGLYENRGHWVPCFFKTTFWASMSTTQRSESMNAFFDGYVHSKTSLKQFVKQYERALRNKVEKEFQVDFKSFSQMVPCATQLEMEQQYQSVYTISKFREVQAEFTGKVYCDIQSTSKDSSKVTYEGILCRHAITVLALNDVTHIPDKYILRRWRRDVRRAHTRVAVNYNGLVSTLAQMRYDEMSTGFAQLANLVADDERRSRAIIEWIKCQCEELTSTKSSIGSNVAAQNTVQVLTQCTDVANSTSVSILDPKLTRRKGAPKKLRRKSPLETASKKAKSGSKSTTCKRSTKSNTSMLDRGFDVQLHQAQLHADAIPYLSNSMLTPNSIPQDSIPKPFLLSQGQNMLFHYPSLPDEGGRGI
ncbi:protein FAR1-RELATED SEQUENCE 5-like [Olea europaea var. sylvestris]|uniref:protein FAR1-RELATED SEQUENCE 5-like n=1 Tax=Olea europaea var. sylvestris TaxID=158386 RepID=UPI000C1D8890|nr:protein FAR1-RELATED SEQUENCE 5-like [Olea europaea var. sylvestris]